MSSPHQRLEVTTELMSTTDTKYTADTEDGELTELKQRLRAVEAHLNGLDAEQRAHITARKQDAREIIHRGEVMNLVVVTPPRENDGTHAISKYEGIYTFIDANYHDLHRGDEVRVRIVDVGDTHAEAILLERCPLTEGDI